VLHTAFSRDQAEKIYVQQQLWQARTDVWAQLSAGGHFYVCGDAAHVRQNKKKKWMMRWGDLTDEGLDGR
jgi:sulfite reductase alpha subunit-like flavoprotein